MEEKTTGEGGSPVEGEQRTAVLYVGDLDPSVTEADLINAFDRFGPPSSARVFRDSNSGSSLRYAFLNFPSLDLGIPLSPILRFGFLVLFFHRLVVMFG